MTTRFTKYALALFAVTALALLAPHAAYADCTGTASGSLDPGLKHEFDNCSGSSAVASATLAVGTSPGCGKLTLWDTGANVLVDRQTGCGGSLSVSGSSVYGGSTTWLSVLTNLDTNTVTYTHYISVSP